MERFRVDTDAAFQMLVRASQDTNIKVTEVAHWLITEAGSRNARPDTPLGAP
jgi:hypothetical protein